MDDEVKLADAYAVKSPDDNRDLYRRWADTYDTTFAADHGYDYHNTIAAAYLDAGGSTDLVLDVGCGTGLVGLALRNRGVNDVHGVDISSAMLSKAAEKKSDGGDDVYSQLTEADLTADVDIDTGAYPGLISAGTFTHGHLGPDSLDQVVRFCSSGALLAVGVNTALFNSEGGFGEWLKAEEEVGRISEARTVVVPVYTDGLGAVHGDLSAGNANGTVMIFRKA